MIFEGTKNQFFFGLGLTRAGKSEPNATQLRKISDISNIPMDYIFIPEQS